MSGDRTGSQRVPALLTGVFLVVLQGEAVLKFISPIHPFIQGVNLKT